MNWLVKISNTVAYVDKGTDTRDGSLIYIVKGNTYPLRFKIKELGFRWYKNGGFWWIQPYKLNDQLIRSLNNIGVSTDRIQSTIPQGTSVSPESPLTADPPPPAQQPAQKIIDQGPGDPESEGKIKFPIKKNIYSENISVDINGSPVEILLQLNRFVKRGGNRYRITYPLPWRKFPRYNVSIIFNGKELLRQAIPINRGEKGERAYYEINEDAEILPLFAQVKQSVIDVLQNPNSKLRGTIERTIHLSQRDPELTAFLKNLYESKFPDHLQESDQKVVYPSDIMNKSIHISEYGYDGDYPITFEALGSGNTLYAEPALEHPLAPYPTTLDVLYVPVEVKSLPEFMQWLDQAIQDPEFLEKAQRNYVKYLKSFPFLPGQQAEAEAELKEILPLIQSQSMDLNYFRQKLLQHGYVRPKKRQKLFQNVVPGIMPQEAPGMVPQEDVKFILNRKKIIEDGYYNRNNITNTPKFFYALLAYLIHRLKAGNTSFIPRQIMDNSRVFLGLLKRYGVEMDYKEFDAYVENLARQLLQEITGHRARGTAWDNWQQFYGGNFGSDEDESSGAVMPGSALEEFVMFTTELGADPERAKIQPKSVYRDLVKQYSTDLNPAADPNILKKLNPLYEALPHQLRAFVNWLIKTGDCHAKSFYFD